MDSVWYDQNAPKRPTNLTLNQDLVAKAKDLGGSLSERVERLLAMDVEAESRKRADVLLDNSVACSNAFIARHGSVADDHNDGFAG